MEDRGQDPPRLAELGECASCGAPILWTITSARHARQPLDPGPVEDGNVILLPAQFERDPRSGDLVPVSRTLRRGDQPPAGTPRYRPHFATCPHALHRRP